MECIESAGFIDAWRARYPERREFSWYNHRGNGFRLDHAFCSAGLFASVRNVYYSHDERTRGISDHSAMIVDL